MLLEKVGVKDHDVNILTNGISVNALRVPHFILITHYNGNNSSYVGEK